MTEQFSALIAPAIDDSGLAGFRAAIDAADFEHAYDLAVGLPLASLREALTDLAPEETEALFRALGDERLATLVGRLDPDDANKVLRPLNAVDTADILDELAPDDAADVIGHIQSEGAERAHSILVEMDRSGDVEALLAFLPETAGGRMTSEFLAVPPDATSDEAIRMLRQRTHDGEFRSYIYVTDPDRRLLGVLPLYRLVLVDPTTPVRELMLTDPIRVIGTDDQKEVARVFREHRFLAVPVVDAEDRLVGVVTADDIADVMEQEATEDMYRMAGVGVKEHAFSPVLESAARRVPWLAFNMVWAFAGAAIISLFEGTLERVAVLAVFMPMIAGQCGNAGIQTATIVVRSMALGELQGRSALRLLRKELLLSMIKGVIFGTVLGVVAWLWKGQAMLGLVAGVALFLNMLVAGTTGVVIPLTLRRLGIDPATIAGVFDTMLTDLMGFLIYLGLATILISRLV